MKFTRRTRGRFALGAICTATLTTVLAIGDERRDSEAAQKDLAWVQARIAEWEPTHEERGFERIGWVDSLLEARRLAREHGRGIFLFTYDGASLSGYRC